MMFKNPSPYRFIFHGPSQQPRGGESDETPVSAGEQTSETPELRAEKSEASLTHMSAQIEAIGGDSTDVAYNALKDSLDDPESLRDMQETSQHSADDVLAQLES